MITRLFASILLLGSIVMFPQKTIAVTPGCDACLANAINQATAQISSSLSSLSTTVQSNVQATDAVTQTIDNSNAALTSVLETQHALLLAGLDAHSQRMLASNSALDETLLASADTISAVLTDKMSQSLLADELMYNRDLYGPMARPLSADIFANRSVHLKQAYIDYQIRLKEEMLRFKEWAYLVPDNDQTMTLRTKLARERIEELQPVMENAAANVIPEDDVTKMIEVYRLLLLPVALDVSKLNEDEALNYHRRIAQATAAFRSLVSDVLLRSPLVSTDDWVNGYVHVEELEGYTSILEFERSETQYKMLSAAWMANIQQLTTAGLLREQIHQLDMSNYLIKQLLDEEQKSLAIITTEAYK